MTFRSIFVPKQAAQETNTLKKVLLQRSASLLSILMLVCTTVAVNAQPPSVVAVTVAPVKLEFRSQPITNSGRISHKNQIHLAFKAAGLVESIKVEEGDEVSAGEILAVLDLEEMEAQQMRAESHYKKAQADAERYSSLYKESLVSLQQMQDAQSAADSAAAELKIVNFNKKLSVIRAAADGRVLKRYVESGEMVQPGQAVLLLAENKQGSVVRVGLIDQDIVRVALGDPVNITLDAYPSREFTGAISEIASATESSSGTFEVEVRIDDQGYNLRSGLIARVQILPASGESQFYLPIESVVSVDNGMATIFVMDDLSQSVKELQVELVDLLSNEAVVRGDLKTSDHVIKLGAPYLSDGALVSVISATGSQ
jgi:RND family efflux transporter MFP subunit